MKDIISEAMAEAENNSIVVNQEEINSEVQVNNDVSIHIFIKKKKKKYLNRINLPTIKICISFFLDYNGKLRRTFEFAINFLQLESIRAVSKTIKLRMR